MYLISLNFEWNNALLLFFLPWYKNVDKSRELKFFNYINCLFTVLELFKNLKLQTVLEALALKIAFIRLLFMS